MPRLAVVLVNWNTRDLTRECLKALFEALDGLDSEVWIVDNASRDDSVAMLKVEFPRVKLIENSENVGFARANNQVLERAKADYYLLLNTDTVVPREAVGRLYDFMEHHPEAGAAGPKLKNAEGVAEAPLKELPTLIGELRYCLVSHAVPFTGFFRKVLSRPDVDWGRLTEPVQAQVLSAACLMIRREVIEQVGLLAEDYFLFSEENDYFRRMKAAGYRGYYLPHVEVIHLLGMSRKKRGSVDSEVNFFGSRQLFFRKHHPVRYPLFKMLYLPFLGWSYVVARLRLAVLGDAAAEGRQLYGRLLKVWWAGK